jgi:hypothetical protein
LEVFDVVPFWFFALLLAVALLLGVAFAMPHEWVGKWIAWYNRQQQKPRR